MRTVKMDVRGRVCAVGAAVLSCSVAFLSGCSGLVSSASNPPPASTLDITNVQAASITTSASQVVWTTNVPANSSVDYGTTTAYGNSTPVDSAMVTSHQMTLSGLAAGTTYYYQVNSTDSKGNNGHGGNKFKTAGFSLSGTLNPTPAGNGATVALSGGASGSATADSSGNYTFAGLGNVSYIVTPVHTGYAFTPGNQSAIVNGANVTGVNFMANAAPVAPTITTQPASQTVTAGQNASFSVTATGTAPLTFQWQKNGVAIGGATSPTYTTPASITTQPVSQTSSSYSTPPTTSSDNGALFPVLVSNTAGSVTSNPATLTVNAAPVAPSITTQPASQTVTAGQTASFSVAATGTAPLAYQWQKNSVAISGATSSSYTTPATTTSDSGAQFTVVVSNAAGSVTSRAATLTVNAAQISVVPTSVSFGNVVTGNSNSQTIKLTNSGTANLTLSQAPVTGNGFSISGLTLPLTLNPGQSTNFNVAFAPAGAGNASGGVSLVGNASNSPLAIPLSGTGVAATFLLGANPASLGFGTVNVGSNSPLGATLTNSGNSNVTISSVTVSGTGFSASGVTAGTTLTPNQSVTLNVTFAPTAAGSLIGTVTVASNATNTPAIIALSGTGAATTTINVTAFGATGNGSTNDTAAINNAIGALTSGATLLFPCGTYLTTSELTVNISNITIDGSSCATIHNTGSGTVMVIGAGGSVSPNYGPAVALSATASELNTSFTTVSGLGVAPGDYVRLQEGGSAPSGATDSPTSCDTSGCRGELLKVASVSGNTITVNTALHDTYKT